MTSDALFRFTVPTASSMHDLGIALSTVLRAGDVVALDGPLGAGKTTLTQGIATGLAVRGPITSPTFVIARVHPSLNDGPKLVHVDAYRVAGSDALADAGIDDDLDNAVVVVEWAADRALSISESALLVSIQRNLESEERTVAIAAKGTDWDGRDLSSLALTE